MPNVERSKCSGGWPELRSSEFIPKYASAHLTKCITFACVITTPFGVPLDPEVNRMCAAASGAANESTGRSEWDSISGHESWTCGTPFRPGAESIQAILTDSSTKPFAKSSLNKPVVECSATTQLQPHLHRIFPMRS